MNKSKLIKKADLILIAAACGVLLVFSLLQRGGGPLTATVYVDNTPVYSCALQTAPETELTYCGGDVVIRVAPGEIYFETSACPDQVCVKTGKLTKNGDVAACLPERVMISVREEQKNEGYETY